MILTKQKINNAILDSTKTASPGHHSTQMTLTEHGNFWVNWAESFITLCQQRLGLEVEAGPGTSVGIIQAAYGPTRYQFDCDWTKPDGRVPGFDYQERGFTPWENIEPWDEKNYPNGLDINNRRFDFILWFTTDRTETENKTLERIGLRFKYPLTCERGYGTSYYISASPYCQPWYKNNNEINNQRFSSYSNIDNDRVGRVDVLTEANNNYPGVMICNTGVSKDDKGYATKSWTIEKNKIWTDYANAAYIASLSDIENPPVIYEEYGGNYATNITNLKTGVLSNSSGNGYSPWLFQYIISKDFSTIDLKIVKKNTKTVMLDILFGNFLEEKISDSGVQGSVVTDEEVTNSFIMVKSTRNGNYMADFIVTEEKATLNPPKQIVRQTSSSGHHIYWGISRLLLDQQHIYCADLYQVFSFTDSLNNLWAEKTFVDKNNIDHNFVLFNYGACDNSTEHPITECCALAMPEKDIR